jgi:hypothetical protein
VILTEWNEFRALDLDELRNAMRGNVLLDLRNVYPPDSVAAAGLVYHGIGRGIVKSPGKGQSSPPLETSSIDNNSGRDAAMAR